MSEAVTLRPLAAADAGELRRIHRIPAVAQWWGDMDEGFPLTDDPSATRFTVLAGGHIAGMVQYGEEEDPDYRHAWIDVFVDPAQRGRGIGTEAVRALAEYLLAECGHHRVTIDPAADNAPAIRSYEKAGFRPVGVMRAAWRDVSGTWRDVLFMEMVRLTAT
jgi:aminoglycoside 6'-N-acetyltransferase